MMRVPRYNNLCKGYKCLDVPSGRVYISRDVIFDESVFLFSKLNPNDGAQVRNDISLLHPTLIPPTTPPDDAVENHVNDSHISVESFDETNMSNDLHEGSSCCMKDPVDVENPSDRSQADSLAQVPDGLGESSSDRRHPWGNDMSPDSPDTMSLGCVPIWTLDRVWPAPGGYGHMIGCGRRI
jgi:hypothetical protein